MAIDKHSLANIAVDCGCGAGRHLEYLREQGFEVHGFDVEPEAMMVRGSFQERPVCASGRCETYTYPNATLVMAFSSLFFCSAGSFDEAWSRIGNSVVPVGIFFGMFMGKRDEWAAGETSFGQKKPSRRRTYNPILTGSTS